MDWLKLAAVRDDRFITLNRAFSVRAIPLVPGGPGGSGKETGRMGKGFLLSPCFLVSLSPCLLTGADAPAGPRAPALSRIHLQPSTPTHPAPLAELDISLALPSR